MHNITSLSLLQRVTITSVSLTFWINKARCNTYRSPYVSVVPTSINTASDHNHYHSLPSHRTCESTLHTREQPHNIALYLRWTPITLGRGQKWRQMAGYYWPQFNQDSNILSVVVRSRSDEPILFDVNIQWLQNYLFVDFVLFDLLHRFIKWVRGRAIATTSLTHWLYFILYFLPLLLVFTYE